MKKRRTLWLCLDIGEVGTPSGLGHQNTHGRPLEQPKWIINDNEVHSKARASGAALV